MADDKRDTPSPRAGEHRVLGGNDPRVLRAGDTVPGDSGGDDASKAGEPAQDQPEKRPDETVEGGRYVVDGREVDANGNEIKAEKPAKSDAAK